MRRATARQKKKREGQRDSPAEAAERAGYGPKITFERGFLVLWWNTKQAAEAMESAGMTLEEVLVKHLAPRFDATKIKYFKHHGQIITKLRVPDSDTQLEAVQLALRLWGVYPEGEISDS